MAGVFRRRARTAWRDRRRHFARLLSSPATGNVSIPPDALSLTHTLAAPTIATGASVAPSSIILAHTLAAPAVQTGASVEPGALTLTHTSAAPAINTGASVAPDALSLAHTLALPSIATGARIEPGAITLTHTLAAPSIEAAEGTAVRPGALTLTHTMGTPSVASGASVQSVAITLRHALAVPAVTASGTGRSGVVRLELSQAGGAPTPKRAQHVSTADIGRAMEVARARLRQPEHAPVAPDEDIDGQDRLPQAAVVPRETRVRGGIDDVGDDLQAFSDAQEGELVALLRVGEQARKRRTALLLMLYAEELAEAA